MRVDLVKVSLLAPRSSSRVFVGFLITSLTKTPPPSLLSLVRWPYLRRILIVSIFFHFGMMGATVLFWTFTAAKRYRNLSRWSVEMEEPKSWHCVKSSTSLKSNYTSAILNVFSCSFCNWIMTHHCLISRLICRCFLSQLVSDEFEMNHNRTQLHGVWLRYFMHVNFSDFLNFVRFEKIGPRIISNLLFPIIIIHKKYQILMYSGINCVHVVLRWSIWAEQSDRAGCCSSITACIAATTGTLFLDRSDKRLL